LRETAAELAGLSAEAERKFTVNLAESAPSYLACAVKIAERELMLVQIELLLTSIEERTLESLWTKARWARQKRIESAR
jgi:hypothetical protein